jgi:multidrug efflux pump subunit AcrA (membrane-fusion protein)
MNVRRNTLTAITGTLVVGALTAAALVNITRADAGAATNAAKKPEESSAGQAITVEVQEPDKRTLNRLLRMPATLRADEQVDLYAKTSGYISAVKVDIGSRVRKGDVLIEIDVPEMHDELRQAEAQVQARRARLEAARAQADQAELMIGAAEAEQHRVATERDLRRITEERMTRLHAEKAIPDQALDEAKGALVTAAAALTVAEAKVAQARGDKQAADAEIEVAEADLALTEASLDRVRTLMAYATIEAPFTGVITRRRVDHGAFVRSAAEGETRPLLTLVRDDVIRLTLDVPESDVPSVHIGTPVDVYVKTLERHAQAKVARTARALDPGTRTMQTEVDIENPGHELLPGMYAQVTVQLEARADAMIVPSKAIRVRGRDLFVLVAADGIARSAPIELGYDDGIQAEILSGLKGGERVIIASKGVVTADTPIVVRNAEPGLAAAR